jgi:hypothetical protein
MWTVLAAILVGGLVAILTDWLFMGVLFHDAYNSYPEIWWPGVRDGETRGAVIWSCALGFVMTAGVVALCAVAGAGSLWSGIGVGFIAFLAGPLVIILINAQFVKTDVWIIVSHSLGYLTRMLIAGAAAGLILPLS